MASKKSDRDRAAWHKLRVELRDARQGEQRAERQMAAIVHSVQVMAREALSFEAPQGRAAAARAVVETLASSLPITWQPGRAAREAQLDALIVRACQVLVVHFDLKVPAPRGEENDEMVETPTPDQVISMAKEVAVALRGDEPEEGPEPACPEWQALRASALPLQEAPEEEVRRMHAEVANQLTRARVHGEVAGKFAELWTRHVVSAARLKAFESVDEASAVASALNRFGSEFGEWLAARAES